MLTATAREERLGVFLRQVLGGMAHQTVSRLVYLANFLVAQFLLLQR